MHNGLTLSLDPNHNQYHIRYTSCVDLAQLQMGDPLTHDSPATASPSNHPRFPQRACSLQDGQGDHPVCAYKSGYPEPPASWECPVDERQARRR